MNRQKVSKTEETESQQLQWPFRCKLLPFTIVLSLCLLCTRSENSKKFETRLQDSQKTGRANQAEV